MEWADFRDVWYLLVCIKHAIFQGLRFIHQNICAHIDRHVREQFLVIILNEI